MHQYLPRIQKVGKLCDRVHKIILFAIFFLTYTWLNVLIMQYMLHFISPVYFISLNTCLFWIWFHQNVLNKWGQDQQMTEKAVPVAFIQGNWEESTLNLKIYINCIYSTSHIKKKVLCIFLKKLNLLKLPKSSIYNTIFNILVEMNSIEEFRSAADLWSLSNVRWRQI